MMFFRWKCTSSQLAISNGWSRRVSTSEKMRISAWSARKDTTSPVSKTETSFASLSLLINTARPLTRPDSKISTLNAQSVFRTNFSSLIYKTNKKSAISSSTSKTASSTTFRTISTTPLLNALTVSLGTIYPTISAFWETFSSTAAKPTNWLLSSVLSARRSFSCERIRRSALRTPPESPIAESTKLMTPAKSAVLLIIWLVLSAGQLRTKI